MEFFIVAGGIVVAVIAILAGEAADRQDNRGEIRRFGKEARDELNQTSNEFRQQVKKTMQQHRK